MSEVLEAPEAEEKPEANSKSYLDMSDEEMMNAPMPDFTATEEVEEVVEDTATDEVDEDKEEDVADDEAKSPDTDDEATGTVDEEEVDGDKEVKDVKQEEKKPEVSDEIDYKAAYERLLAPFKANGRDIAVKSIDDAIALMQMGANYNKKMAALKPHLKILKTLEHNGLLSDDKIGFLIDLDKRSPEAISKLVKDSGIDPMDLDAEKASEYKQTTYTVDDREIELDTVLDEIQDSPSYNRTLGIVSNKWDSASKQAIAASPQLLRVINDHVESGIYDIVSTEVESERVFGRLKGLSDIAAYQHVGDVLNAKGAFNHLVKGSSQNQRKPDSKPVVIAPKVRVAEDDRLKDKRRAASSTKPAVSSPNLKDFNPLALSDEEFSKLDSRQFL